MNQVKPLEWTAHGDALMSPIPGEDYGLYLEVRPSTIQDKAVWSFALSYYGQILVLKKGESENMNQAQAAATQFYEAWVKGLLVRG